MQKKARDNDNRRDEGAVSKLQKTREDKPKPFNAEGGNVVISPDHPQGNRPMTDDILELEKGFILEAPPRDPTVLGFMAVKITQAIASLDRGSVDEATLLLHEAQEAYFRYVNSSKKVVKNWA